MKILITVSLLAAVACGPAMAHGDAKAQHGGVAVVANDLSFELTSESGGAAVYIVDHGKPADASKMSGKLTVLNGTAKSEGALKPAGGNKLVATGMKLEKGAKAVALVQVAPGQSTTVRFTFK